jgi:TetR/AcrR family transcriptional regulator, transcriptional repressor for nem operon
MAPTDKRTARGAEAPQPARAVRISTRDRLLDAVERLMIDDGYAAVSYRAVAAHVGVVPSNVQYYFPTLEDLLVATVRRRTEQSLAHLVDMLEARPDQPLRVLWEFGRDETTATLAFEFSAMGNHHKAVRAETTGYMRRLRAIQLDAIAGRSEDDGLPPAALLFLLTGIPKLMQMEADFDVEVGHREIVARVERYLDERERRPRRRR